MASLRDVLNHIGTSVEIVRDGAVVATVKATERAGIALLEARTEPRPGDELRFVDTSRRLRVGEVQAELHLGKLDHYRVRAQPI